MIIKSAELETVIGVTSQIPQHVIPEFAFAGKSNVGKSSLINAMLNRHSLARVSGKPGKTQTINYYNVNKELYLVDLPGYGYTKAAVEVKAAWGKMVEKYLRMSHALRHVFLLSDSRHAPSEDDLLMYKWISDNGFEPVIIATKTDKLNKTEYKKQMEVLKSAFNINDENFIPFSAKDKKGVEALWDVIEAFASG